MSVSIDLTGEKAVSIGATYKVQIQLCNAPDLLAYTGLCQVKTNVQSAEVAISPAITVLTKDIFEIAIAFDSYSSMTAGNYIYDVLFQKSNDRFYAVDGKIQFIKRVTNVS